MNRKIDVALVGLAFGGAFAPIYRAHPGVGRLTICDCALDTLELVKRQTGDVRATPDFAEVLADPEIDAVHLVTPIPDHARHVLAVLEAGKHCACTVPMATSLDDVRAIVAAVRRTGLVYMLMETTLRTYQFHHVRRMLREGALGRIQFLRGTHYQDMANWPWYWAGLPPMWYGTHAVAPLLALAGSPVRRVSCLGSGTMDPALSRLYGNPFPIETAHLSFATGLKAEVTRSLCETAIPYQEGLCVYGSRASFCWGFRDTDPQWIATLGPAQERRRGRPVEAEPIRPANDYAGLPEPLRPFTVGDAFDPLNPQESLGKGAGGAHHGSHPHLVHEFVRCVAEGRRPEADVDFAANLTAACLLAHESALRDGEPLDVPPL